MNKFKKSIIYLVFVVLTIGIVSVSHLEIYAIQEQDEVDPNCPNNIAYKKNTIASEALSNGPSSNAVDGIIADNSRWLSTNKSQEYWIEIDLGKVYDIVKANVYTGKDDTSWAVHNFVIQYWNKDKWVDISVTRALNNKDTFRSFEFDVTTDKVRFFSTDGSRGVRIRELQILKDEIEEEDRKTLYTNKKVYADYHGPRYTREHDGNLGNWKFVGDAKKSNTDKHFFAFNGDLIDENGKNQIATTAYPIVGMQSQLDKDYIEYQVLLAKMAHIDGFFVEWGFPGHGSDKQLKIMQEIAGKYDFEVGVNWCDAWHMKDWIKSVRPDIQTDEDKVEAAKDSLQYLLDEVYNTPTGALFEQHPVIYLFGGGFNADQFNELIESTTTPEGILQPWCFRRTSMSGQLEGDNVKYNYNYNGSDWSNVLNGPFGWIPNRIRDANNAGFNDFDFYATTEDTIEYLKTLKQVFLDNYQKIELRNSVVTPAMDNRACAGWGTNLKMIDRANGKVYEEMWKYNVDNRDYIDTVYIASWNDYTEGHQIEPTQEDGYRELITTEKYTSLLKQISSNTTGIYLPERVFKLRKRVSKLERIGFEINLIKDQIDDVALKISRQEYNDAETILQDMEYNVNTLEAQVKNKKFSLQVPSTEVNVITSSAKNIAFNKEITTNGNNENLEFIVDGVTSGNCAWESTVSTEPIWLDMNLGNTFNITNMFIATGINDNNILRTFKVQYINNGNWIDIPSAVIKNNTIANLNINFETSITTDHVRVLVEDDMSIKIREMKLFSNEIPTAKIISPQNNEEYECGQDVTITVEAEDIDGDIVKIDLLDEDINLGEMVKEANTYTYKISNIAGKHHHFRAVAYDNDGAKTESDIVAIYLPIENIALNKPVKANAVFGNYGPERAVDGIISLDSRWRTPGSIDEHWLIIDLEKEYEIIKAELHMGDETGWAVRNFELQYMNEDDCKVEQGCMTEEDKEKLWKTINSTSFTENKEKDMEFEFEIPIKARKIRFYSNEIKGRGIRIKEIKLFAYKEQKQDSEKIIQSQSTNVVSNHKMDKDSVIVDDKAIKEEDYDISNGAFITFSDELCSKLIEDYYEGYLTFEYLDDDKKSIKVFSDTDKIGDFGNFTYVCSISKTGTGEWKQAKVRLYKDNIKLNHSAENDSDLVFKGNGKVRNITFEFEQFMK